MGKFTFDGLSYGLLNDFRDSYAASGDPRRDNSKNFINHTLRKLYSRDALQGASVFNGVVVSALRKQGTTPARSGPFISKQAGGGGSGGGKEGRYYYVYKVYIPELESRPAPRHRNDKVLESYPDVHVGKTLIRSKKIPLGGIVKIRYGDVSGLLDPKIIAHEGNIKLSSKWYAIESSATKSNYEGGASTRIAGEMAQQEALDGAHLDVPKAVLQGKLTFADVKLLGENSKVKALRKLIVSHEGGVESVNRGSSSDSPGGAKDWITKGPYAGKNLVELTIQEVMDLQIGGKNAKDVAKKSGSRKRGFFAVGKGQFVPPTLNSTVKWIKFNPSTVKYDAKNQNYLIVALMMKGQALFRNACGSYLVGLHNNIGKAGNDLANIWASIPLQLSAKYPLKGSLVPKNAVCEAGYGLYCYSTGNGAKYGVDGEVVEREKVPGSSWRTRYKDKSTTGMGGTAYAKSVANCIIPHSIGEEKTKKYIKALKAARDAVKADPQIQDMLKRRGIIS